MAVIVISLSRSTDQILEETATGSALGGTSGAGHKPDAKKKDSMERWSVKNWSNS